MQRISMDPAVKFFISSIGLIAIFLVLKELQHIFIPFVLAYFLFFIFQPLNTLITRKRIPYGIAVIADLLIVILFVWGLSRVIIVSFERFSESIPSYEAKLNNIISNSANSFGITDPVIAEFNLLSYLNETLDIGGLAGGFFSSTLSFVSTVFFVLFFFIFISGGHNKIINAFKSRFSDDEEDEKNGESFDRTIKNIPEKIQHYLVTKSLISLLTALSVGIVLWLFDIDFLVVWVVLTFLLNFIPNIGSVLAVIFPTLIALVQYESFGYALLVGGIITGVQNIYGSLLEPKIMGDRLGINPLIILLSLLLWGYIWGLVGMFLSVPITAVIKILVSESNSPNLKFVNGLMG